MNVMDLMVPFIQTIMLFLDSDIGGAINLKLVLSFLEECICGLCLMVKLGAKLISVYYCLGAL